MIHFLDAYEDFKLEGEIMGYSNNLFIFLNDYFISRIYHYEAE